MRKMLLASATAVALLGGCSDRPSAKDAEAFVATAEADLEAASQ